MKYIINSIVEKEIVLPDGSKIILKKIEEEGCRSKKEVERCIEAILKHLEIRNYQIKL